MKKLSREEVVKIVGIDVMNKLEAENPEPTNRVGLQGISSGDALQEWAASIKTEQGTIVAYYLLTNAQQLKMESAGGDGSVVDWKIDHYEIL